MKVNVFTELQNTEQQRPTRNSPSFTDQRPAMLTQRKLADLANNSPRTGQLMTLINARPGAAVQNLRQSPLGSASTPIQTMPKETGLSNNTGLPDKLKAGVESMSGMSMEHVRVHYNSDKPAQLQAHAYAQGRDIHVAPGQEHHLPHEAWHVVQQAQGRVKATRQMKDKVNDDQSLESEANIMGARAATFSGEAPLPPTRSSSNVGDSPIAQLKTIDKKDRPIQGGYADLVKTAEWKKEAVNFETRLGTFASTDARAEAATKKGLTKMANIFKVAYNTDDKDRSYLKPFGIDDKSEEVTSAGQVGKSTDDLTPIREVVEGKRDRYFPGIFGSSDVKDVNHRERMTAFYNGAYFGKGYGGYDKMKPSLKKILHEIVLEQGDEVSDKTNIQDKMELAKHLDLDVEELIKLKTTMGGAYRQAMNKGMQTLDSTKWLKDNFLFAEDVFGVGNLANNDVSHLVLNHEMPLSHRDKRNRTDGEKVTHAKTPADYAGMGVPLSPRERAFVNKNRKDDGLKPITDAEKLPWREGIAFYYLDPDAYWTKSMAERGFSVVSAISGTTARMMSAYKWLNLGNTEAMNFRLGIMGWMLTSRDHSLYEIMRGAEMVGVKGPDEDTSDPITMYMHIAPLSEEELRAKIGVSRMFPHESTYVNLTKKVVDNTKPVGQHEGLLLPGTASVNNAETTKDNYGHGGKMSPSDLNLSHVIALRAYTGPDHHVLNAIMQWYQYSLGIDNFVSISSEAKISDHLYAHIASKWDKKNNKPIEYPAVVNQLLASHPDWKPIQDVLDNPKSTQQQKDTAHTTLKDHCKKLATQLKKESGIHINMLDESLKMLPAYAGVVYMGTWEVWGGHTGGWTSNKTFSYYQSTSKSETVALRFAKLHTNSKIKVPVLYKIKLKAGGHGRDIQNFSQYTAEQEVLLMPPTTIAVKPSNKKVDGISYHDADEA